MTEKYKPEYRQSWALVIGIDAYQDASLPPLATAVKGARAFADLLRTEIGFPKENITLLENEKATQRAIRRAFTDPLSQPDKVAPDDRVVIYYGGHGVTHDTAEGEIGCIAPYDTEAKFLDTTIPMDELTRLANRSHSKHVLFLLDACFSGYATVRASDTGIIRQVNSYLTRPVRQVITAGAREQAVSDLWGPDQHSLFTGFLLEGLRGAAPAPGGILRAFHLAGYLQDQVGQHSRSHQTPQYAALMGSGGGDFIFEVREVGELPMWLMAAIEADEPAQRLFAVGQLRMLAEHRDLDDDALVLAKLEELTNDSDSMVRASARGALRELMPSTKVAPITRTDLLAGVQRDAGDGSKPEKAIIAVLTFTDGPAKGGQFEITGPLTKIGRSPEVALVVWDDNMSREHAQLEVLGPDLILTDLGSRNGTYVNGERISAPHKLKDGDRISMGKTMILVSLVNKGEQPVTRTPTASMDREEIQRQLAALKEQDEAVEAQKATTKEPVVTVSDRPLRVIDADVMADVVAARRMEEHADIIYDLSWSPDGARIATASADKLVIVWDAATGKKLLALEGHTEAVMGVGWSPDGKRLATAGADNSVMIWDAETGKRLRKLENHTMGVLCVEWSADSKWLASGGRDNRVVIWDAQPGSVKQSLEGHRGLVFDVAWAHEGGRLASASGDSRVIVWDSADGHELFNLHEHETAAEGVAWSPDGKWLASAGGNLIVWNAETGKSRRKIGVDARRVTWSADGKWLAAAAHSTVIIFDAKSGREVHKLTGHTKEVMGVGWSPDSTRLASVSADRTLTVWEVSEK